MLCNDSQKLWIYAGFDDASISFGPVEGMVF